MSDIPPAIRTAVVLRAGQRCEYCGLSQAGQEAAFHIDHIVPRTADGPTTTENLALACGFLFTPQGGETNCCRSAIGRENNTLQSASAEMV